MDEGNLPAAARFTLGQIVCTPAVLRAFADAGQTQAEFLSRHVAGDWGKVDKDDAAENELAIKEGSDGCGIFSAYILKSDREIWIITEPDRTLTTVQLSNEQ